MPVPLNVQAEDIVTIIDEAELACLICSLDELGNLSRLVGGCTTVKKLIVMDLPSQPDAETEDLLREVGLPDELRSVLMRHDQYLVVGPLCLPVMA